MIRFDSVYLSTMGVFLIVINASKEQIYYQYVIF